MSVDLNQIVEYFRLKDRKGMDPKVLEDIEFRERTNSAIWINNPNYVLTEDELKTLLDSTVRIKGEQVIMKTLLQSASGVSTLDYYATRNSEPQSALGQYKIHKNRILHYLKTGTILPKEGANLKYVSFEATIPVEQPTKEDFLGYLRNIWNKKQIVYLDTETTGLYPERGDTAIQIYLLRTFQGKKVSDLKLYIKAYKNPPSLETIAIHHIDENILAEKAVFPMEALTKIKEFLESSPDTVVVGHNVDFDMRFLQFMYNDWKNAGVEPYAFPHLDSMEIVKNVLQKYNPNIKKQGLSYIITEYLGDIDLEELDKLIVAYIDRTHNQDHDRYNGNKEQFEKDTIALEKKILKNLNIFLTKEKENKLLVDKDTNLMQGFYEKFQDGSLNTEQEKVETLRHLLELVKHKIDRRHQADYDVIQTYTMVEKMLKDFGPQTI